MLIKAPLDSTHIDYLKNIGILSSNEEVTDSFKAGEGNMNVTLTIKTNKRTIVLKQSRPFVAKYPQVPAPLSRIEIEYKYYNIISPDNFLSCFSPKVLAFDKKSWLLVLEHLNNGGDYLSMYQSKSILGENVLDLLLSYLKKLHQLPVYEFPDNMEMRKLNHQHIFVLPFQSDNGFNLDDVQDGLQTLSERVKNHTPLKAKIKGIGDKYLGRGKSLIHGDFYPGSWFETDNGLKIIDTEFSFLGDPEFDLGVMLAHLKMARIPNESIQRVIQTYPLENGLISSYMGVEILRRLFGLAQLPLNLSIVEKEELTNDAINLIMNEEI
ncbi:phosphotransferase [Cyclobacterium marinum]|uniref:Aminoglycoside phosphotransferase n=1 Tax=Cyclobacterium marinum (strain ATCC 25205 / DSM 745 / LMG 13164 / NCIMB 1802) TaxID=880070 RepID=G0J5F0_CYCMS|nr:phosphotransferase [Cyclobacterium marinum]AEL27586.1 aminoglycoside phosphotransferase [Cyclobacterium marinum DSM 745]